MVYKTGEDSQLRAAITRSLARPNFEDMAPWRFINIEDMEIELGNPDLDVTTAWNFDLMWEIYMKPVGIFSAGVFYKDLSDIIYLFNVDEVIDGEEFEVIQPRNGDSGELCWRRVCVPEELHQLEGRLGRTRPLRQLHLRRFRSPVSRSRGNVAAGTVGKCRQPRPGLRKVRHLDPSLVELQRQEPARGRRRSATKISGSMTTRSSTSCSMFRSRRSGASSSSSSTSPTSPTPCMKAARTVSASRSTTAGGRPWV